MLKKILVSIHISMFFLVMVHLITRHFFSMGFSQTCLFWIKMSIVITGCYIAIRFFKSLKWKRFYFGIYPFGIALFLLGYILKGMVGGILTSATIYPIVPDEMAYTKDAINIYTKYTGFFSRCCTYTVLEKKGGIFETYYGEFSIEGQSTLKMKNIENTSKLLTLTYKDYVYDNTAKDMILIDKTLVFKK